MEKLTREQKNELNRKTVLKNATLMFLRKGYNSTTIKEICENSAISVGSFTNLFGCKENLMCDLVKYVLEAQFAKTEHMLKGITDDKILLYAAETTLQLHIAESSEHIRELYSVAYTLPGTTEIIRDAITSKLEVIFHEHLPNLKTKDFYILEIASGGIMRSFMSVPCNMWFTMEDKIRSFLSTALRIYGLSDEKINDAIDFVSRFDYKKTTDAVVKSMLEEIG